MANPTPNGQHPPVPPYGVGPGAQPLLPISMKRAVGLMWAGAGLSVVYSVANGVMTNNLFTAGTTDTPTYHGAFIGGAVFAALLQVALWLWMLWKVRVGRSWARILSAVFFGFMCLQFLFVVAVAPGVIKVVMTAYFIVALSALIMLYQRECRAFFAAAELARNWSDASYMQASYMQASYGQPGYGQPGYGQSSQPYREPPQHGGPQRSQDLPSSD